jgi:hypothetical protein
MNGKISYGSSSDIPTSSFAGQRISDVMGELNEYLNMPSEVNIFVDGVPGTTQYVIKGDENIEFVKPSADKG